MFKSPLKVHGEYLIAPCPLAAALTGTQAVRAGGSMSGLELLVCVEAAPLTAQVGDAVTLSIYA